LWAYVIPHFRKFLEDLELTVDERADAESKADRIARCLWDKYYPGDFNPACCVKVGSYGKQTAIRPPSDLDMLFVLPPDEYYRAERLMGTKQSQLLQRVKTALEETFSRTDLRADGQVILARFQTYAVEVIPAFIRTDGTYITAHTADNGSWRASNPVAEYQDIKRADSVSLGKATDLTKMLKAWKRECSVDIKSISLEVLAREFVAQWKHRLESLFYYDWLVRDFFEFMLQYKDQGWTRVSGTQEIIWLGTAWVSKCETAYKRAYNASEHEHVDHPMSATEEWQKIFGKQFVGTPRPANSLPLSFLARAMAASR
jgi:hypothetical protein